MAKEGEYMETELYRAAVEGNDKIIVDYANRHGEAWLIKSSPQGNNILHVAAKHGHVRFMEEALKHVPALARLKNNNGDTPLHVAASVGGNEAVKLLLIALSDIDTIVETNNDGDTPLHLALKSKNQDVVDEFLGVVEKCPDICKVANNFGETPLHVFARFRTAVATSMFMSPYDFWREESNHKLLCQLLRAHKFAACLPDKEGLTPLLRAAENGHVMVLQTMLEHCPHSAEVCDAKGRTVLHLAKSSPDLHSKFRDFVLLPEIKICKDSQDFEGNTPAHIAAEDGDLAKIQVLREALADLTITNKNGISANDAICRQPSSVCKEMTERAKNGVTMDNYLYKAAEDGDPRMLKSAMDSAQQAFQHNGHSAYLQVSHKNMRYFLSQTQDGDNIIHIAISKNRTAFIQEALMCYPCLIFQQNFNGDTALHIAARNGSLPGQWLFKMSATDSFQKALIWDRRINVPCPPWRVKNLKGNTAFHDAVCASNYKFISSVLTLPCGPEVLDVNNSGETALHMLAKRGISDVNFMEAATALVEKSSYAAYMRDLDGLTPLSRAAETGRFCVALLILRLHPKSMEISDDKGRIFLHHLRPSTRDDPRKTLLQVNDILRCMGVESLRDIQDDDGKTPLHLAILSGNVAAAEHLMDLALRFEGRPDLTAIDTDGNTVSHLLASHAHICEMKELHKRCVPEYNTLDEDLYNMAVAGDVERLTFYGIEPIARQLEYYGRQTEEDGSNILHLALKYEKERTRDFVDVVMRNLPSLLIQPDNRGETPLHLAANLANPVSTFLLQALTGDDTELKSSIEKTLKLDYSSLWLVKNSKGNNPLHEALRSSNLGGAVTLLRAKPNSAFAENDLGECPLHLYAKHGVYTGDVESLKLVIEGSTSNFGGETLDKDGLSPLLRAAKSGRFWVVQEIVRSRPVSAYLQDPHGRTFLHHLSFTNRGIGELSAGDLCNSMGEILFKIPEVDEQRWVQDNEGNTTLHYAITTNNFMAVKLLLNRCLEADRSKLFSKLNNEGETIRDLFLSHDNLPDEIVDLIEKVMPMDVKRQIRSSYGIRRSEVTGTAETLSVIAGLLATMTFAAAFQVPGGYNGDDGSPFFLKKTAFQIFLMSDTVALCGSMTVLFALLWLIGQGANRSTSYAFRLLDAALDVLQISFYATLLAFMTGVYVGTVSRTAWLAISVCVICSFTTLLVVESTSIIYLTKISRLVRAGYGLIRSRVRVAAAQLFAPVIAGLKPFIPLGRKRVAR